MGSSCRTATPAPVRSWGSRATLQAKRMNRVALKNQKLGAITTLNVWARTMMQKPGLLPVFWALLAVIRAPGLVNRRKFRSQTSDYMDRWKAEKGRGREKRKIRRKKSRRERVRRKKMQMREKVGKSRNTVFFQWFGAPEGRKVGSLKRRVRSQLARWEMKKLHAVVARSTFASQNVQSTPFSDHFW